MNVLTDLPPEMFYGFSGYLDLLDLAALLWTCKKISERIAADFTLQKIFLNNTPYVSDD